MSISKRVLRKGRLCISNQLLTPSKHTNKKEDKNFCISKEIQKGSVATASSYMAKHLLISSYINRKPFLIYDFATDPN
jgi:hypothetical protein